MAGTCTGSETTISYGERTVTHDTPAGPCRARTTTTFDADGIPTNVDYGDGTTGTYTTTSRATVCR
jgi:hypothetical protein